MPRPKDTAGCQIDNCGRKVMARKMCSMHWSRWRKWGNPSHFVQRTNNPSSDGYIRIRVKGKPMVQHRYFMENYLGRILLPSENIHHINGVRHDNRLENLEIWDTRQPKGQKIFDKIEYALEILNQYAPQLLKENKNEQSHSS